MGFIGFVFLFWISGYIPDWVGAIIALAIGVYIICSFVKRAGAHQELRILSTLGYLICIGYFIFTMLR